MSNELSGEFVLSDSNGSTPPEPSISSNLGSAIPKTVKTHFYTTFAHMPEGLTFQDQEADETILLLLRRHFVTNIPWIASALILSILPIVLFPFILAFFPFPLPSMNILILILAFYYLLIFGITLLNFTLWYFQVGLVTSLRIIDVDINGILYRQVSEARNDDIQDVSYEQVGFLRSLFNYGIVLVQTSASIQNIEFDRVPKPSVVSRIIADLIGENV